MSIFLTEIKIKNFRGIEDGHFKLSRVNFFVSENGTGKTSCMAAIARLFPLLRNEERVFLDADFRVNAKYNADPISIQYRFKFSTPEMEEEELSLDVEATRSNAGVSKSHLNAQKVSPYRLHKTGSHLAWGALTGKVVAKGKQRVVRNGWLGNRICPIDLNQNPLDKHAATSMQEETGASDGFRARMVAILQNTAEKPAVEEAFPDLEASVVGLFNSTMRSDSISDFRITEGASELSVVKKSGVTTPFTCLSGGEIASVNLAMSKQFILKSVECDLILLEEPETSFHPTAQTEMMENLLNSFSNQQIFISTHSPFVLEYLPAQSSLIVARRNDGNLKWRNLDSSSFLFGKASIGELCYLAYNYPTFDYMNQIYGFLQNRKAISTINKMDEFLAQTGLVRSKTWIRDNGKTSSVTLATYIRNHGHHPENQINLKFTTSELMQAISDLRDLI